MKKSTTGAGIAETFKDVISIIPIEKNKEYTVKIDSVSSDGNGVAHIDGYTLFIPNSAPGDILKILAVKVKSNYGYGKIKEIITPSPRRIESACQHSAQCGGCNLSHLDYRAQLELKKDIVNNAMSRIGGFKDFKVSDIIGMENPFCYRNKMVFPFGKDKSGGIQYGFYRERSHDIIPLTECMLGDEINFKILREIKRYMENYNVEPYNEHSHTGAVRRVFIRKSYHTNELMVVISSNSETLPHSDILVDALTDLDKNIISIILNINKEKNNLVLGIKNILLFGKMTISDCLCGLEYEISANSFFQVNPVQTEILYKTAIELADISKNDTVLDIYCGIGTISLYAAKYAKNVIGVEIVPQAIENAKQNAENNSINNAEFHANDAAVLVPKLIKEGISPDIVILDPPRKGSDEATLSAITSASPDRIVYISCNPATLARDMKFLSQNGYSPKSAVAVDMFPHTSHVETVCLMSRVDK